MDSLRRNGCEFVCSRIVSVEMNTSSFTFEASALLIGGGMEVWERFGIGGWAWRGWDAEGFEGSHGGDPRRDGGGEVFREEGAEGLVLPGLNVAGGPVVEQADAEEVMVCLSDGDGCAEKVGLANVKCEFEFVV